MRWALRYHHALLCRWLTCAFVVASIEEVKKEARMGQALEKSEADQRCALYSAETVQVAQSCKVRALRVNGQ